MHPFSVEATQSDGQRVSARDRLYLAAEVPSLVLWGERDRIIPIEHGRRAHREMPGSRFIPIPEAGHFIPDEQPDATVDALTAFIDHAPVG